MEVVYKKMRLFDMITSPGHEAVIIVFNTDNRVFAWFVS